MIGEVQEVSVMSAFAATVFVVTVGVYLSRRASEYYDVVLLRLMGVRIGR